MPVAIQGAVPCSGNNPLFTKNFINNSLNEIFTSYRTKKNINYAVNGSASLCSLFTFLNGNFNFLDSLQEKLEPLSEALVKIAFSTVHVIGAIDLWQKKNIFPFVGYLMAPVIALISSGYDLWVATGLCGGLINFAIITDRREVVDDKGNPVPDKDGNIQVINGDFKDRGWQKSFETTIKESFKMIKEIYTNPSRIKNFAHAVFLSSSSLIVGSLLGMVGLKKTEVIIRNIASVTGETALLFHTNTKSSAANNPKNTIDLKSPVAQSGFLWIGTAVVDMLKRFDYISENINNLTHLSLAFDRMASIRFTQGILNINQN